MISLFGDLTAHRHPAARYGAPKRDAEAANIVAVIKGPERNSVLARTDYTKVERIPFLATVGDAIIGKHLTPRRAIDAYICPFDTAGCVFHVKHRAHAIRSHLDLPNWTNDRRSIVDVYRFADSIT